MNVGMVVLVGCVLGTGALVYQGTMAGAAPATPGGSATSSNATPHATVIIEPTGLAHAGQPTSTPASTQTPLPRLTLDQVRGLTRPGYTSPSGIQPVVPSSRSASTPAPGSPTGTPPGAPVDESGNPPTATAAPKPPAIATGTPVPELPRLATPPPLPPPPEWVRPQPAPTEHPW